jgi:hypothetical protein
MTEDQVLDLLGRPSETYTFQMVKLLPHGSRLASVRYGKNWDRGYEAIRLLFEEGRVVQKSEENLPERVRQYAGRLLHGPRSVPPPLPVAPATPTTSPPQGSVMPQ